jgi:hypothetical protein
MNAACARLAAVDRHVIPTQWCAVEYAERGQGEPMLVLHGIFDNCVGRLLTFPRDLSSDRPVIVPSRFGYLPSSIPPNATHQQLKPTRSPLCSTHSISARLTL